MKAIELETLAVMFRNNDPNLWHVSTFEVMQAAELLYYYGMLRGIPQRHTQRRRELREQIAYALEQKAKRMNQGKP